MKLLNLNIGAPSIKRAQVQLEWLRKLKDIDIMILTEAKGNEGCNLIVRELVSEGYNVFAELPSGEYGVIIATKFNSKKVDINYSEIALPSRMTIVNIMLEELNFIIMGVYVPSNDKRKNVRKKRFMEDVINSIKKIEDCDNIILCGDFNTVTRTHVPKYGMFRKWEYDFFDALEEMNLIDVQEFLYPNNQVYSWFGRTGNSYKYDYCFVSSNLISCLSDILYSNESIEYGLTDHSLILLEMKI